MALLVAMLLCALVPLGVNSKMDDIRTASFDSFTALSKAEGAEAAAYLRKATEVLKFEHTIRSANDKMADYKKQHADATAEHGARDKELATQAAAAAVKCDDQGPNETIAAECKAMLAEKHEAQRAASVKEFESGQERLMDGYKTAANGVKHVRADLDSYLKKAHALAVDLSSKRVAALKAANGVLDEHVGALKKGSASAYVDGALAVRKHVQTQNELTATANKKTLAEWSSRCKIGTEYCGEVAQDYTDNVAAAQHTFYDEWLRQLAPAAAQVRRDRRAADQPDPTAKNAHQWRQIAWTDLKDARAAIRALQAAKSDAATTKDDLEKLTAAASLAAQKAASSQATRETADAKAAEAAAAAKKVLTAKECVSSQDKPIHCRVTDWTSHDTSACSDTCDEGGTVKRTRTVQFADMCGGDRCPALSETTACPAKPTCVYQQRQAVQATIKLNGVDEATYSDNKAAVHLALKAAYGAALAKTTPRFQIRFQAHDLAATPTEGLARRRRLAPASSDTELVIDVETDGVDVSSADVRGAVDAVTPAAIAANLATTQAVTDVLTDVFVEHDECKATSCAGTACGWTKDSCGTARWCGDCGMEQSATNALTACANDGDCSHLAGLLDAQGSLDKHLTDTSQLL